MRQIFFSFLVTCLFLIYARFLMKQTMVVHSTTFVTPQQDENGTHFIRRLTIANATTFKSLHKKAHHWAIH